MFEEEDDENNSVEGEGENEQQAEENEGEEEGEEKEGEEEEEAKVEEEEEEFPANPLSEEMMPECISLLCKIGSGLAHAYVKLDCKGRELTNIELLKRYIHLRYVDLSNNHIKDISPLSNLSELLTLKCENNALVSGELAQLPYLQYLNLNNNKISSFQGINHPLLEHLSLNFNRVKYIEGVDPSIMSRLHTLELRGNQLASTDGLHLPNLKNLFLVRVLLLLSDRLAGINPMTTLASSLNCATPNPNPTKAGNRIRQVTGLGRMESLTTLHLRDNQIETLDGFTDQMKNLQYLNMRGNGISSLKELNKLKCLPMLRAVVLSENPIAEDDEYRLEVLTVLRKVIRLDKDEYQDDEREEAEARYEQRRLEELNKEQLEEEKEEEEEATPEAAADDPVEE